MKDEVGPSVGAWLRSLCAAEFHLRARTGEPLRKIAEDYGFRHQTDFRAEYKRWYKVSPRDYLKEFRKANPGVKKIYHNERKARKEGDFFHRE